MTMLIDRDKVVSETDAYDFLERRYMKIKMVERQDPVAAEPMYMEYALAAKVLQKLHLWDDYCEYTGIEKTHIDDYVMAIGD